jgi:hypothetical protein
MNSHTFRAQLGILIEAHDHEGVDALVSEFLDSDQGTRSDRMHEIDLVKATYPLEGGFGGVRDDPRERAVQQLYETAARYL